VDGGALGRFSIYVKALLENVLAKFPFIWEK